jgi:hypothetical protein
MFDSKFSRVAIAKSSLKKLCNKNLLNYAYFRKTYLVKEKNKKELVKRMIKTNSYMNEMGFVCFISNKNREIKKKKRSKLRMILDLLD